MSEQPPPPPQDPEGQPPGWEPEPSWSQEPGPGQEPTWGQQPGWGQQPPPGSPPPGAYGTGGPAFSAGDAVGYGWKKFFANPGPFLGITALILVAGGGVQGIGNSVSSSGSTDSTVGVGISVGLSLVGTVFSIVAQVIATLLSAAAVRGALDVVEGQPVTFGGMFERWDKLQVLIAALIISVVTAIGIVLCVLPGIVVIFLTFLTTYFIVGGGRSAIDGITDSVKFTANHVGELLLLALLCILVTIAGALACFVGLLVAIPVATIATAYAFRVLHGLPAAP